MRPLQYAKLMFVVPCDKPPVHQQPSHLHLSGALLGSTDQRLVFFPLSSSTTLLGSSAIGLRLVPTVNFKTIKRKRRKCKKMRFALEILSEKPQTKKNKKQESKKPKETEALKDHRHNSRKLQLHRKLIPSKYDYSIN